MHASLPVWFDSGNRNEDESAWHLSLIWQNKARHFQSWPNFVTSTFWLSRKILEYIMFKYQPSSISPIFLSQFRTAFIVHNLPTLKDLEILCGTMNALLCYVTTKVVCHSVVLVVHSLNKEIMDHEVHTSFKNTYCIDSCSLAHFLSPI